MAKKILVVYYSQSGQLKAIADNFVSPFVEAEYDLEMVAIKPKKEYKFPWSGKTFFDAMPESVLSIPAEIEQPNFKHEKYDLILFAYQPWFLSPSIPAISILHNDQFRKILKDTSVITLIGSRNMWIMGQEKIKKLLKDAQANLIGNIVLTDKHTNLISAITIQYWMFTGKKDNFLGVFPKPGISDKDIESTKKFGKTVLQFLENDKAKELQEELIKMKAVEVNSQLMFVESRGSMLFNIWANIIVTKKNRSLWLTIFKYYLVVALFFLSPFVILIYIILLKPILGGKIKQQKEYYLSTNYNK